MIDDDDRYDDEPPPDWELIENFSPSDEDKLESKINELQRLYDKLLPAGKPWNGYTIENLSDFITILKIIKGKLDENIKDYDSLFYHPRITIREKLFTTEEAAKVLNLHPATLRKYIREGIVNAVKVGRNWKIKHSEVYKIRNNGLQGK